MRLNPRNVFALTIHRAIHNLSTIAELIVRRGLRLNQSYDFAELLAAYGQLLTEKQRRAAEQHFRDKVSLSEIARRQGTSRQAVHDTIRHTKALLQHYEDKLRMGSVDAKSGMVTGPEGLRHKLESLRDRISRQSIIYSTDWIRAELNEALALIAKPEAAHVEAVGKPEQRSESHTGHVAGDGRHDSVAAVI